jgi:hypothetical protein
MTWKDYATYDDTTHKVLYKGVDIGLKRETVQDLIANSVEIGDHIIEEMYNRCIEVIRDKKIDEIIKQL